MQKLAHHYGREAQGIMTSSELQLALVSRGRQASAAEEFARKPPPILAFHKFDTPATCTQLLPVALQIRQLHLQHPIARLEHSFRIAGHAGVVKPVFRDRRLVGNPSALPRGAQVKLKVFGTLEALVKAASQRYP